MNAPILRDGDIYFWRWTPEVEERRGQYAYHCKSRKAVADNGRLIDTYWGRGNTEYALDFGDIDAVFQGNETDLRRIDRWTIDYYDPEDIVDLAHPNNSGAPVYIKPDATRSAARILEHLNYRREQAEYQIRSAQRNIELIAENIARVEAGDLDRVMS